MCALSSPECFERMLFRWFCVGRQARTKRAMSSSSREHGQSYNVDMIHRIHNIIIAPSFYFRLFFIVWCERVCVSVESTSCCRASNERVSSKDLADKKIESCHVMHVRIWPKWPSLKPLSAPQSSSNNISKCCFCTTPPRFIALNATRIHFNDVRKTKRDKIEFTCTQYIGTIICFILMFLSLCLFLYFPPSSSRSVSLSLPQLELIEFEIKKQKQCIVARYHSLHSLIQLTDNLPGE